MAMLTLNGAALPDPSALSVELQDALLSARRTLSGAASVSRAAVKRRVRCYWAHMPAAQLAAMLSALAGSAVATLSYPDPLTGQSRAMQAYCGERSVGLARLGSFIGHGSGEVFVGFSTANGWDPRKKTFLRSGTLFAEDAMNLPFRAMAECAEEAVLNSMLCAHTLTGYTGRTVRALPELWTPEGFTGG